MQEATSLTFCMTTSSNQRNVGFIQDNSKAILPVISANVKSPDDKCGRASVFYDSGVQVSMIRDAFAEEMGLKKQAHNDSHC